MTPSSTADGQARLPPQTDASPLSLNGSSNKLGVQDPADTSERQLNPLGLLLLPTEHAGRGLFARQDIPAGTVLERSPVLVLSAQEWGEGRLNGGVLGGYAFSWVKGGMGIGLGIASMFNHSASPNVNFLRSTSGEPTLTFTTTRRVPAGTELCICYSADESKLWFSPSYAGTNEVDATAGPSTRTYHYATSGSPPSPSAPLRDLARLEIEAAQSAADLAAADAAAIAAADEERHARQQRRKREREEKQRRYEDKQAARREQARARAEGGEGRRTDGDEGVVLANGSSETGVDRTPGGGGEQGTSPPISDEAYAEVVEQLGMVEIVTLTTEQIEAEAEAEAGDEDGTPPSEGGTVGWSLTPRIKGTVEAEQDDESRMLNVWTLQLHDTRMFKLVNDFIKQSALPQEDLKHLKRIKRDSPASTDGLVVLCPAAHVSRQDLLELVQRLASDLTACPIKETAVPAFCATTLAEVARKSKIWPVIYSQRPPPVVDLPWTAERRAWVRQGVQRIITDALAAARAQELPIATYVACPPAGARITKEGDIPPTPLIRAAAHDTRKSRQHPLKHAALNCIANVASLRTMWPASATLGTRNGADYLLTSLSLFITHEPCLMCTMALLHSRVKEIFYILPSPTGDGGFASTYGVHGHPSLNHQVDVFDCSALVSNEQLQALRLPHGCNV